MKTRRMCQVTIDQSAQQGYALRQHYMRSAMNDVKPGEVQKVFNVLHGGPVQQGLWILQADFFGECKQRLPQIAVPVDNDPGARMTDCAQPFKNDPDIVEITHEIRENDVVERLVRNLQGLSSHLSEL